MKILHLNYYDIRGGAAIASNRIVSGLNTLNKKNKNILLVFEKKYKNNKIICKTSNIDSKINNIKKKISFNLTKFQKIYSKYTHSLNIFNSNLLSIIDKIEPDIIHLHWINNEFISIKQIKELSKKGYPLVWTMHDMWPYCGAEHYTKEKRFINGYTKLNKTKSNYGIDLNRYIWELKKKYWKNISFEIICPSKWQLNNIKKSSLFCKNSAHFIPLGIDIKKFNTYKKKTAQRKLNLDTKYKYLLFGSTESPKNNRKGLDLLIKILNKDFFKENKFALLFYGKIEKYYKNKINIPCYSILNIKENDYKKMSLIFSSIDMTLVPSRIESFGLIALESLACGRPVITFKKIGTSDLIIHRKNGFLANYLDMESFYRGIKWYYDLDNKKKATVNNFCKSETSRNFDIKKMSKRYLEIYKNLHAKTK